MRRAVLVEVVRADRVVIDQIAGNLARDEVAAGQRRADRNILRRNHDYHACAHAVRVQVRLEFFLAVVEVFVEEEREPTRNQDGEKQQYP
jgi:hypothetical protein